MVNRVSLICLILLSSYFFLCLATFPLLAQSSDWAELSFPGSGNISSLYANGNTLLAARAIGLQNTGVYRSTDNGRTWTELAGFETNTDGSIVGCFVAGKDALFAAGRGVLRSSDGGQTWTPLNNGLTLSTGSVLPIACLAVSGNLLAAVTGYPYQAVYLSTNGGASWSQQRTGLPVGSFLYGPVAISEGNILLCASNGLYRYSQETRGWTRVGSFYTLGSPYRDRDSFVVKEKNLFIIGRDNNPPQIVFRSSDGGASWTGFMRGLPSNQIPGFSKIFGIVAEGALLYAPATAGESLTIPSPTSPGNVYFSDDDGESWGVLTKPLALDNGLIRQNFNLFFPIAVSGADVYAANREKLYRATLNPPVVSAASYRALDVTGGSIASIFGSNLSNVTAAQAVEADAPGTQLPLALADVTVQVTDSAGRQRNAFLFAVSPRQINFQIPPETAPGLATVSLASGSSVNTVWRANISLVAPSLFAADASGKGLPAGLALRVKADGTQSYEAIFQYDAQNRPVALPLDLSRENETVYLVLFGTGVRGRSELAKVTARVGSVSAPVEYAGPVTGLIGLDQINLRLPRMPLGRGEVEVELQADGKKANLVKLLIK